MVRRPIRSAKAVFLLVAVLAFSACSDIFTTVFPKQLGSLENAVSIANYVPVIEKVKDNEYSVRIRSFLSESGNEYVVMLLDFDDMDYEDTLLIFSSSLKFLASYTKTALLGEAAGSYEFSTLMGMGTGERIVVGLEMADGSGKIAVLDPDGGDSPIIQNNSSDYSHFAYLTAIPYSDKTYFLGASAPNMKIGAMDSAYEPLDLDTSSAETATQVQVFQSSSSGFVMTEASYNPGKAYIGVVFRNSDNEGYVVILPVGVELSAPLVGSYQYFSFSNIMDSESLFYTGRGIVNAPAEGTWYCIRFDGVKVDGPEIESWDSPRTKCFSVTGKHYFYYDDAKLNLGRAKTWW